jgi:hypothetical protein
MLGRGGWGITGCRVYGRCRCVQVILEVENYGQEKEGWYRDCREAVRDSGG